MASTLTTTALVKSQLDITTSNQDTKIDSIVAGVNAALENILDETFDNTPYADEEYDILKRSHLLVLKHTPVITFTQLQFKDKPTDFSSNDWSTINARDYKVDLEGGVLTYVGIFRPRKKGYRVTYTAGYATIPADLQYAATKLASSYFDNSKNSNVTSETLGQFSKTWGSNPDNWKTLGIDKILSQYQKKNWFAGALDPNKQFLENDFTR